MYSTASPPPKKEGAKSITPSGIKRGKTANRMATPVCILPDHSSGRNIRTEKRQDFLPLFCAERRRFGEDISNPCRRHTETLHYSRFTLHFYHPKQRKGEKPRHTPSVPGIARELLPARGVTIQRRGVCRGGRAFPGRPAGLVPRDRAHIPSECRQRPGGCPGPPVPPLPGTVPSVPGPSCRGWLFPPGCHPASG